MRNQALVSKAQGFFLPISWPLLRAAIAQPSEPKADTPAISEEPAGWRRVAVNGHCRRHRFACRLVSYKGKRQVFVFVGASLLANGGG
jgi:hypothetical protein